MNRQFRDLGAMGKQDGRPTTKQGIILDSITDGVFTVDHDWNITYFNRAAEKITGGSREQAVGQKCYDVFRANICQDRCALRRTMEGEGPVMNLRIDILACDGHTIPISVCASTLRDEAGVIVGGVETFRCADYRGDEQTPDRAGRPRRLPRRPLLPTQRGQADHARAGPTQRRPTASGESLHSQVQPTAAIGA